MFDKILCANRGEIAVRVIRACREMGIKTVAVYSEADKNSLHAALADECVCVGGPSASSSYLNQENIISAALATGARAIHPGYGFLAENASFARLCEASGIVFIGPDGDTIEKMGNKNNARELMIKAGVPVIPGSGALSDAAEAKAFAESIGYPVLIKASAGGGGKGIRLVGSESELEDAFINASEEARRAFSDGEVYMEKYLSPVRHIEVQVLADEYGNTVTLGERDCSLQLNRQKVIEETPCPVLSEDTRQRMFDAARAAVSAAGYTNAGTVEFLLDGDGNFYFIEMNTRLQVEHAVSEEVSGIDIVKWQIRIASKLPLSFTQDDVVLRGHSIECRVNAKSQGQIDFLHLPSTTRVHFDSALVQGERISPLYDSMLGKLVVYAPTRDEAIRKTEASLAEVAIQGVETNIDDLHTIIFEDAFQSGEYD
ncbi:MAG: acetyl/propionyl/methylcrotonyl-CoA carboxylase subunit alpha, partial [Lachnospiraceae bacterium]